ncbi:MAG: rhomboid family intramembrane serine protease [Lachnospiraceae bacterium]|nr:rhomboid family intramembrane serine protease [Lachnospiraceae bacterium]
MKITSKFHFNSPVILTFVIISFIAYVLNIFTYGRSNSLIFSVYRSSMASPLFYVRLIGHVFGHANWNHFSGNMIFILLVGPLLEEKYGSWNMAVIIFFTAIVTGIVNVVMFSTGLLGASGVVFALILLSSITSMKNGRIPLTFVIVAIIYIGGQLYSGVFVQDNISNLTHMIGGILGCIFGYMLNRNFSRKI